MVKKRKINILGVKYSLKETPCVSKDEMCLGKIDVTKQSMKIDNSLKSDIKAVTILHEVIHGILYANGLDWQDEALTQSLATGLYQVLKTNKTIF